MTAFTLEIRQLSKYVRDGVGGDDYRQFEMRLQRNVSTLAPLVEHIDCCEGGLHRSPLEWRPFLSALSANSPICGLLHPKVVLTEILRRAVKRRCFMPTDLQILQLNFPLLFELVSVAGYLPSYRLSLMS